MCREERRDTHGEETKRKEDYTEKRTERRHTRRGTKHGGEITQKGDYANKGERIHTEMRHTERGHTLRLD